MGRLIFSAIASLDGYVADVEGKFDWSAPDPEVHAFVNDVERPIGTHLYGRRMYEVLSAWETIDDPAPEMRDYAEIWRAADKVVYSTSLHEVATARTHIERAFSPQAVARMKAEADRDLAIGGPTLAAHALRAGLVDEVQLFLNPVIVGGGLPALPDGLRAGLTLREERRFTNGVVFVRYEVSAGGGSA